MAKPSMLWFQEDGKLIGAVIFTNYSKNDIRVQQFQLIQDGGKGVYNSFI